MRRTTGCRHPLSPRAHQLRRNAGILLKQAAQFEEEGDLAQATMHLGRYLAYVPEDTDALARYGELLAKFPGSQRTQVQAAFVLEQVLRRDPKRDDVRRKLVKVEMGVGRFTDAREHLDLLLKGAGSDDGELEALLGRCQEAAGQFAKAVPTYQKAIQHGPGQMETYVRLARLLRQRLDQPARADQVMDELVKANSDSARAHLARGRYRLAFDLAGAADDIKRARIMAPDDADVYLASAQLLRRDKKWKEARQLLERALQRHPKDFRFYHAMAQTLMDSNRSPEAIACLRQGLKAAPNQSELAWVLAEQLIAAKEYSEGADLIARMRRAGLAPARLDYLQARLLMGKQQWAEAARLLEAARPQLTSTPDFLKLVELAMGECQRQLGNVHAHLEAFRRAIALDSRWLPPRLALGTALAKLGRAEEAKNVYQQAVVLPGAPGTAWLQLARLGMALNLRLPAQQQDWKQVEGDLDQAAKRLPGFPGVTILRAQLLSIQNQPDQALLLLEHERDRRPEQIELWAALVGLAEGHLQHDRAQALLQQTRKQLGDTEAVRLLAAGYWSNRPPSEARPMLAGLAQDLERFPAADRDQLLIGLANAHYRVGLRAEARQLWDELARRTPDDLNTWLQVFNLSVEAGDRAKSVKALAEIKRVDGSEGAAWRFSEAVLLVQQVRKGEKQLLPEARTLLKEVAVRRPGWARVPLLEGEIAELEKRKDIALEKYQQALDLGERRLPVIRRVVQLLYERHRFAEADQVLRRLQGSSGSNGDLNRLAAELSLRAQNSVRALELAQQAVSPDSRDYRDHIWLGQVRAAAGKSKEAEESFRRALQLGKKEPAAWMALVHYLAQRKQPEQAEELLREAKTKLPAEQASLTLAAGYEALGKGEQAEATYLAALKKRPKDLATLAQAARFYLAAGRRKDAEPHLRTMLDPKISASEAERAFARRGLAVCLADRNDYARFKEALALLEQNAKKAVDLDEDRRALATVLAVRPSRHREAIQILEELAARQRLLAADRFLLARLFHVTRDWMKARSQMLSLLTTEGSNPTYLAFYVDALLRRGDQHEAAVWLDKMEKVQPRAYQTIDLRARLLQARGKTDEAVRLITSYAGDKGADLARAAVLLEDLGHAPAAEPLYRRFAAISKAPEAVLALALYLARRQKVKEALGLCEGAWSTCRHERVAAVVVDVLQAGHGTDEQARKVEEKIKAVARERTDTPIFELALGQLYYQRRQYGEAEERYRVALRIEPENLIGLNNLAWLLTLRSRNPEDALKLVDRGIAKTGDVEDLYDRAGNRSVPNLLDTRAVTYLALGRVEAALKDLEPAVAATPTRSRYYHLSLAYRMAHNGPAAERALREAAKLGFKDEQVEPMERATMNQLLNRSPGTR